VIKTNLYYDARSEKHQIKTHGVASDLKYILIKLSLTYTTRQESTDMKLLHLGEGGDKCHADGVSKYRHRVNIIWETIERICRWKLWRGWEQDLEANTV
jgi:hypothetical protein